MCILRKTSLPPSFASQNPPPSSDGGFGTLVISSNKYQGYHCKRSLFCSCQFQDKQNPPERTGGFLLIIKDYQSSIPLLNVTGAIPLPITKILTSVIISLVPGCGTPVPLRRPVAGSYDLVPSAFESSARSKI